MLHRLEGFILQLGGLLYLALLLQARQVNQRACFMAWLETIYGGPCSAAAALSVGAYQATGMLFVGSGTNRALAHGPRLILRALD